MKILYVANHDQANSNDDEGSVTHALQQLGHDVIRVSERKTGKVPYTKADLLLFHKWHEPSVLSHVLRSRNYPMPKVFWFFDLVDWPSDPSLKPRCDARKTWMRDILPLVDLGFCTDGDWVDRVNLSTENDLPPYQDKLVWLPQGFDERLSAASPDGLIGGPEILFTGVGARGGVDRESFIEEMTRTYGSRFLHVPRGLHGKELARLVASAKVVVAPDSPVTDRYWSNRVYLTLGLGGVLLHPWSKGLDEQYNEGDKTNLFFYNTRKSLHGLIEVLLTSESDRALLRQRGRETTLAKHTYRHRVETLLRIAKERLKL